MSAESELLQRLVEGLFAHAREVSRLDALVRAESADLPEGLLEIVTLLPPGQYSRQQLCDQLNSALVAHGWTGTYRTVD